ncbi:MAG: hypothetical protein KDE20_13975, partial [Caldilineaceae bacterium]|nr:hypothetical protein [Caldilineaceae bacterium]
MSHQTRSTLWRTLAIVQVVALVLTSFMLAAPAVYAAPAPVAAGAPSTPLNLVQVTAPDINCVFDGDCTITVADSSDTFTLPGGSGDGVLQSRLWPAGEAGTPGQDLYPYIYRIDATKIQAVTAEACVTSMAIDFGPVAALDYDGNNEPDQVFVITKGGLGDVAPAAAQQTGDIITFLFREPVCPGMTSFFFGLASKHGPADVQATLEGTLNFSAVLDAKAPAVPTRAGQIAYVYREDRGAADQFRSLLEGAGFTVKLIPLSDVLATDFTQFDLAIVADDTGNLDKWGDAPGQDTHILSSGIPVIGLNEGGYAYFGRHGMQIGWPNGWHGSGVDVRGVPGLTYYQTPADLTGLLGAPIALYPSAVDMVSIYMPTPIAGVTPLGWEPADNDHAPLIAEKGEQRCQQLWGFGGPPDKMTAEGARLFINAVVYGLDNCPDAAPEPEPGCYELFSPREIPSPTLIDFDDVGDAVELETVYQASHGVTFGNTETTHVISYADRPADPTKALSSPNVASNDAKSPNTSAGVPMTIRFDSGKTHVGFYMGNGESQNLAGSMVGYDAAGNVVCQVTNTPVPEEYREFIGMYDPAGRIQLVTLDYGKTALSESIDNLYFAPGPNPEEAEYPTPQEPLVGGENQPVVEVGESTNKLFRAHVQFPEAQLWPVKEGDQEFVQFAVPGLELADGIPGEPDVPVLRRIIAVPRGATAVINGIRPEPRDELNLLLYPVQESPVDTALAQDTPPGEELDRSQFMDKPFVMDEKAYAGDMKYPEDLVSVVPLGRMRDLDLVQINIAAGQYYPAKQSLTLFDNVEFEIVFEGGEEGFLPERSKDNLWDSGADALYAQVLNYTAVREWVFPGGIFQPICIGTEFTIVTDPAFRPAADTLRTWKVQKGISTNVVETGNDPGDAGTTREQIRDYIQNRYDNCLVRPSYVLLLGDAEHIAPFYRNTNAGSSGTDLDYALMNPGDILPDLGLGRIPVDTLAEAQTVVDKIVGYEQNPPFYLFGGGFYSNMSFAAYFQCCRDDVADDGRAVRSFLETSEFARAGLTGLGYNVERIYTTDASYESAYTGAGRDTTPRKYYNGAALPADLAPGSGFAWDGDSTDIINAFNEGRFLVFHRDHGWSGGWGDPSFTTANIDSLSNGNKLPVIYSVNCSSGYFDNETAAGGVAGGLYWAEKALRLSGGGAVGVIGDTRNSPTWANSALSRGLFDATWPSVMPATGGNTSITRLGDILNYAKVYLAGQVGVAQTAGSVSQNEANTDIVLYHVYGDPTMAMWTSNPNQIQLPELVWEVEFDPWWWHVRYPIEGAIITLLQDGQPVGRGKVANGMAELDFLEEYDASVPYELSAELPGAVATELKIADATGRATPSEGGGVQNEEGTINVRIPANVAPEALTLLLEELGEPDPAINTEWLLPAAAAAASVDA